MVASAKSSRGSKARKSIGQINRRFRYRLTGILTPVSSPEHRKQRKKRGPSAAALEAKAQAAAAAAATEGPSTSAAPAAPLPAVSPIRTTAPAATSPKMPSPLAAPLPIHYPQPLPIHHAAPLPLNFAHNQFTITPGIIMQPVATIQNAQHFMTQQPHQPLPQTITHQNVYTDPTGCTYSFLQPIADPLSAAAAAAAGLMHGTAAASSTVAAPTSQNGLLPPEYATYPYLFAGE